MQLSLIHTILLVILASWTAQAFSVERLVCLVNQERVSRGLKPLIVNAQPSPDDPQSFGSARYGGCSKIQGLQLSFTRENVAVGDQTEESVVYKWMHSDVHRRNILTPSFTHTGAGFDPRGNYWTMEFLGMDQNRIDYSRVPVCP
ncbi:hypothetical protein K493DRAFT_306770 [Basidiobolus meristosporus CBS 931.73]|uniref:SCP domain-containing protein n=1 Tax=Basidiobolus meristosporus CBS 931.73 TaxID=1314790 RepID=A0A1Y1XS66_9FUNG|nr:hypothetical protein K493DRAFT_306770 [Basidiobolus meristosporus CBS 931.73]|eukprot:ORX88154.1 hypothetical protein K493DRAFT_306770 [Basidiobolus meristosporus CBS 931.73]